MTSKLRLKLGRIEVEFEGTEEFIKQDLSDFLAKVKELGLTAFNGGDGGSEEEVGDAQKLKTKGGQKLSVTSIAAKFNVDSGTELVIAAMAKLCIVDGAEKATRKEISAEMKKASTYFKKNYISNLSTSLGTLVSGQRLLDHGSSTFTLSATEKSALEAKLA